MHDIVKVFIVCKNDVFFRGIEHLFNAHCIVFSGICRDPDVALEQFDESGADMIIMDANWWAHRGYSAKQILDQFLTHNKHLKIMLVSTLYDPALIYYIKQSGAKGYFCRTTNGIEQITNCIRQVYLGQSCFLMQ